MGEKNQVPLTQYFKPLRRQISSTEKMTCLKGLLLTAAEPGLSPIPTPRPAYTAPLSAHSHSVPTSTRPDSTTQDG